MEHDARKAERTIRKMGLVMVSDGKTYRVMGSDETHRTPDGCLREVLCVLTEAERSAARHAKRRHSAWQR